MTTPAAVWESAALRGLDARARADLGLAARSRKLGSGQSLYSAGDPADHLFVVAEGSVVVEGADGSPLRSPAAGDTLGEESLVFGFGTRPSSARGGDEGATVVGLPAALLRRVLQRSGTGTHAARLVRTVTRAAIRDAVLASRLEGVEDRMGALLDGARLLEVARGDVIARAGEERRGAYVVVLGVVRLEADAGVVGHLGRGLWFRPTDPTLRAVAGGPVWLALVSDEALRVAGCTEAALRRAKDDEARAAAAQSGATQASRALDDLVRLETARSLLVLDGDACVRCGHCASACATAHSDGRSRLLRAGPIVALDAVPNAILPSSCEHCRVPACLPACPTGAIARIDDGTVLLTEDLCTGCGSCVKACPWENLALAPRLGGAAGLSADVAIKCDLCHGRAEGPACVAACPVDAVQRFDARALPEVRTVIAKAAAPPASSPVVARRARPVALEWAVAAAAASLLAALGRLGPGPRLVLGVLAGAAVVALVAYGAVKRVPSVARRLGAAHVQYLVHVLLGVVAVGAVLGHAAPGGRASSLAHAALLAFVLASALGAASALAYRLLPARISRLVRRECLPEELSARARSLTDHVSTTLSGRSDLVKAVYARVLGPYRRSPIVRARLFFSSGRTLDAETRALEDEVRRALEGRGGERLVGLEPLVAAIVEDTAFRVARPAMIALRAVVPTHAVAAAALVLLVIVHAISEVFR